MRAIRHSPTPLAPWSGDGGHIPALDGVRALAILLVMGVHTDVFFRSQPTAGTRLVDAVMGFGWGGVDLFFVLSGFLITGILFDTRAAPGYYTSFYARRALRIFPLYYVALAVILLVLPILGAMWHHATPKLFEHQAWLWTYTTNIGIALHGRWELAATGQTVLFWSLAVEEQFYLVWPFLVAALSPRALTRLAGAMVVGALLLRLGLVFWGDHVVAVYVSTLTRMDALAMGALVALAARRAGCRRTGGSRCRCASPRLASSSGSPR